MELILGGQHIKLGKAHDISVPVQFGEGLSEFGAKPASKAPYTTDGFTGAVYMGGSCNCDYITFSPHLHGTHTECVGHIVKEPVAVHEILQDAFMLAQLITVKPQPAAECNEHYAPVLQPEDMVITRAMLEAGKISGNALVVRTGWQHGNNPAFFTIEAMEYVFQQNVQHLLVDMPSIDRLNDEGKLTNHHIFWGIAQGSHTLAGIAPSPKTITELIHAPDALSDGNYMLNLQVAAFASDAAPSRPLLYEILQ